ncbi:hypothetical protein GQ44DRAFT_577191, partial [Phaeosphaeriaceae sp. PMI808]
MAFRQQQRPQSSRQQKSYHAPDPVVPIIPVGSTSQLLKRPLDQSEEWVLFSPVAPSAAARTHTTSTDRTARTAGLSRFSEFGSLETAAQSEQDGEGGSVLGTEEELDSLDEGLHAFHEPSEYGPSASRLLQSGETVLPTHDGLGAFEPDAAMQEHMWQFERPRRRIVRRRSSVQRHFTVLDDTEEGNQELERRHRIEKWRLDQSKVLLEEIEKETRRRRRISIVNAAQSQVDSTPLLATTPPQALPSITDTQSESSDDSTEGLSFWQRITRRVIRDLIGLDEDTLSIIFGGALPEEPSPADPGLPFHFSADKALQDAGIDTSALPDNGWQTRLLKRVAQELGTLVHQLSEHPGAFSTYQRTQSTPEYAGLTSIDSYPTPTIDPASSLSKNSQPTAESSPSAHFAPTFPTHQTTYAHNEASLWGIEEEPAGVNTLPPTPATTIAEDLIREREYWERDLDVKMIFNFLVKRFTSRRSSTSSPPRKPSSAPSFSSTDENISSARRAAIIRQHHPLVSRTAERLPTSSPSQTREKRKDVTYRTYYHPQASRGLRSNSSCASQSTKKSKRSRDSTRNYWDLGGSVGSGSAL